MAREVRRPGGHIQVTSIVSNVDRLGRVNMHWQDQSVQFTPGGARELSKILIEAAEAAEQDAAFYAFNTQELKLDEEQAYRMLLGLRAMREKNERPTGVEVDVTWDKEPGDGS